MRIKAILKSVEVYVSAGTHINDAKREAITAAVENECDATFTHNDTVYEVWYAEMMKAVREVVSKPTSGDPKHG